jgi:hypothetical protein
MEYYEFHRSPSSAARKSNAIKQIAKQINQISRNLISNKQIQNPGFGITFDIFDIGYDAGEHTVVGQAHGRHSSQPTRYLECAKNSQDVFLEFQALAASHGSTQVR